MFSVARTQASSWIRTPLFSNVSRLLASHRAELFHFHLQDPAGSTQGCGLCYALFGPPSWCGHSRAARSASAPAPVWDSSHLTPPSPPPPSGTFPSRPPSPSSCCYTLRISYLNPPHRAAVKNFPGRIICQPRILILLGPSHIHTPSFTTQLWGKRVQPVYHLTRDRVPMWSYWPDVTQTPGSPSPSLPLHCLLTFSFSSRPPIATMVLWASQASHPGRPAVLLRAVVGACTSRRRTADPFVKLVSYLQ